MFSAEQTQPHFKRWIQSSETTTPLPSGGLTALPAAQTALLIPDNKAQIQHQLVDHLPRPLQNRMEPIHRLNVPLLRWLRSSEEPRRGVAENLLAHCCVTIFWSGTGWNSRRHASSISLLRKGSQKKCKNYCGERKVVDYRWASLFCQITGK